MNRSRLAATLGGAVTLLLTAGTALALAVGSDDTVPGGAGLPSPSTASTASTASSTDSTESTTSPTHSTDATGAPVEVIDSALAVQIALSYTGGGTVTNVEREFEHGRIEWKVRIETGGKRFDIRVDTATGAITRVDVDDRTGDDRDGDDRDGRVGDDNDDNSGPGSGDDSDLSDERSDDRSGSGGHGHDDPSGDDHGGRG